MSWKPKSRLSLRAKLLALLLPGMLAIICAELWLTRLDAIDAADAAFDRSLNGAIRSLDANVSTASGGLAVELPYRLFEFFQLTAQGTVYFRVATSDGLVEIGNPDLPQPDEPLELGVAVFHDAVYFGEPVRIGTYVRALDKPLKESPATRLVIQVAEGGESRRAFTHKLVLRSALRDAAVISLVGVTLAVLVTLTLRPVSRLAAQVAARKPYDLRPIGHGELPPDIQPLVDAVNHQLARTRELMDGQRAFLDDASHQLRTPLATLHAQVGYALRQRDPGEAMGTLGSIADQLEQATRSTNQLLALARNDAAALAYAAFDLNDLVRDVATRLLPLARAKALDFGVEAAVDPCIAEGDRNLLAEAASNLVHNALSYTPEGGAVTIAAAADADGFTIRVTNGGEAIPDDVRSRLGQRFLKGPASRGAGLGLAIAKSVVERHGGRLQVDSDAGANCVSMHWPRRGETP